MVINLYRLGMGYYDLTDPYQVFNLFVFCSGPIMVFLFNDLFLLTDAILGLIYPEVIAECKELTSMCIQIIVFTGGSIFIKIFLLMKDGTNFQKTQRVVNSLPFKLIYLLNVINFIVL